MVVVNSGRVHGDTFWCASLVEVPDTGDQQLQLWVHVGGPRNCRGGSLAIPTHRHPHASPLPRIATPTAGSEAGETPGSAELQSETPGSAELQSGRQKRVPGNGSPDVE